jgi:hypothetical protein
MAYYSRRVGDEGDAAPAHGSITFIVVGQAVRAQVLAADNDPLAINQDELGVQEAITVKDCCRIITDDEPALAAGYFELLADIPFLVYYAAYRRAFQ